MIRLFKSSLLIKFISLAFIAQLCAGLILLLSSHYVVNSFLDKYIQDEVKPIKTLINTTLAPLLFAEDIDAAIYQLNEMDSSFERLEYLILKDTENKIIATQGKVPVLSKDYNSLDELNGSTFDDSYHLSFNIVISEESVGHVYIGLDLELQELLKKDLNYSFLFSILFGIMISTLLIGLFAVLTIKRLNTLVQKTTEISAGLIDEDLDDKSDDEIGKLSKAFNHMQENLRKLINGLNQEIIERKEAEEKMINQSKQAALGEMLANIAHQWRQPLSTISTSASGLQVYYENENLDKKNFNKFTNLIIKQTQYLSKTIETFRNFMKNDENKSDICIQNEIREAIEIIGPSIEHKFITLKDSINYDDEIKVKIRHGELTQVIINIINNAKDVLLERLVKEPVIHLSLEENDNYALIKIEDNAGGVPKEILTRIFEPYFTTKHQKQGTGLGLYMSYKIVIESMKGELYVKNNNNGAIFYIKIPTSL